MTATACFALACLLLTVLSAFCFRMAAWHRHEAGFWREIGLLHDLDMAPDDAPALLAWTQSNYPTVRERLHGWRAPHVRRRLAESEVAS